MARLSTPSHPCETQQVNADLVPTRKCGRDSYRKAPDGTWRCKPCRRRGAGNTPTPPGPVTFAVVAWSAR